MNLERDYEFENSNCEIAMPHQLYPVSTYITNKLMGYVGKSLGAEITGMLQKRSIVFP